MQIQNMNGQASESQVFNKDASLYDLIMLAQEQQKQSNQEIEQITQSTENLTSSFKARQPKVIGQNSSSTKYLNTSVKQSRDFSPQYKKSRTLNQQNQHSMFLRNAMKTSMLASAVRKSPALANRKSPKPDSMNNTIGTTTRVKLGQGLQNKNQIGSPSKFASELPISIRCSSAQYKSNTEKKKQAPFEYEAKQTGTENNEINDFVNVVATGQELQAEDDEQPQFKTLPSSPLGRRKSRKERSLERKQNNKEKNTMVPSEEPQIGRISKKQRSSSRENRLLKLQQQKTSEALTADMTPPGARKSLTFLNKHEVIQENEPNKGLISSNRSSTIGIESCNEVIEEQEPFYSNVYRPSTISNISEHQQENESNQDHVVDTRNHTDHQEQKSVNVNKTTSFLHQGQTINQLEERADLTSSDEEHLNDDLIEIDAQVKSPVVASHMPYSLMPLVLTQKNMTNISNYSKREDPFLVVRTKSNPLGSKANVFGTKPLKKKAKPSAAKEAVKIAMNKLTIDTFMDLVRLRNPQPASALIGQLFCMVVRVFRQVGKTTNVTWEEMNAEFSEWSNIRTFVAPGAATLMSECQKLSTVPPSSLSSALKRDFLLNIQQKANSSTSARILCRNTSNNFEILLNFIRALLKWHLNQIEKTDAKNKKAEILRKSFSRPMSSATIKSGNSGSKQKHKLSQPYEIEFQHSDNQSQKVKSYSASKKSKKKVGDSYGSVPRSSADLQLDQFRQLASQPSVKDLGKRKKKVDKRAHSPSMKTNILTNIRQKCKSSIPVFDQGLSKKKEITKRKSSNGSARESQNNYSGIYDKQLPLSQGFEPQTDLAQRVSMTEFIIEKVNKNMQAMKQSQLQSKSYYERLAKGQVKFDQTKDTIVDAFQADLQEPEAEVQLPPEPISQTKILPVAAPLPPVFEPDYSESLNVNIPATFEIEANLSEQIQKEDSIAAQESNEEEMTAEEIKLIPTEKAQPQNEPEIVVLEKQEKSWDNFIEFDPLEEKEQVRIDLTATATHSSDEEYESQERKETVYPITSGIKLYSPEVFADCPEFRLQPQNIGEFLKTEQKLQDELHQFQRASTMPLNYTSNHFSSLAGQSSEDFVARLREKHAWGQSQSKPASQPDNQPELFATHNTSTFEQRRQDAIRKIQQNMGM